MSGRRKHGETQHACYKTSDRERANTDICSHGGDIETETDEILETIWEMHEDGLISETHFKESEKAG